MNNNSRKNSKTTKIASKKSDEVENKFQEELQNGRLRRLWLRSTIRMGKPVLAALACSLLKVSNHVEAQAPPFTARK
jgi:hypothetical protein